jgi:hypothetical protein
VHYLPSTGFLAQIFPLGFLSLHVASYLKQVTYNSKKRAGTRDAKGGRRSDKPATDQKNKRIIMNETVTNSAPATTTSCACSANEAKPAPAKPVTQPSNPQAVQPNAPVTGSKFVRRNLRKQK